MILYHLCGALLEENSIILPGSYGNIVNNIYGNNPNSNLGNALMYFYEEKLETHRQQHCSDKPSRFECVFTYHSVENLTLFREFSKRFFQYGYQVTVVGDISSVHYADWKKYNNNWSEENDWKVKLVNSVLHYWNEKRKDYLNIKDAPLEILLPNKLKVVKRVI